MKVTIYGSIENGGDGSAGVQWCSCKELAELMQEYDRYDEGWAESCITSMSFTIPDGVDYTINKDLLTPEAYLKEIRENEEYGLSKTEVKLTFELDKLIEELKEKKNETK